MGIEQKVEQMYKALEAMEVTEKLASVKPEFRRVGTHYFFGASAGGAGVCAGCLGCTGVILAGFKPRSS
jgi:hypothetical protein